jgi:diguanylate cyclase (GGDEF)-like protein
MSLADAMDIMRRDVGRAFDPSLFEVFERLVVERGPAGGTAVGNAGAPRRPSSDDLTELPLRRACTAASTRLLAARRRDGTPASLLYLKVMGLDAMRQQLGQVRADDALATVAGVLRRMSRRGDVLARFGADDFVLLVSDANPEQALGVAGRVRAQLVEAFSGGVDSARIAIGVASAPEHGDSLDALVAAARLAVQAQPIHATNALAMADGVAEPPRPAIERFVGRVAELRRLEQMLDATMRGDARIVTIAGAPGIGKTSLLSRLMLDARRRGAAYVVGSCRPAVFQSPYAPWISIIEGLRAARAIPDRRWHALPNLVPSLAASQRSIHLVQTNPASGISLTAEIADLLTSAASQRPIVIVLEDAEHADLASWEVIEHLATRLGNERVMLCLTTTDDFAGVARTRFSACQRHYELRLSGLTPDDLQQWLTDLFVDPVTADACARHLASPESASPLVSVHALHSLVDEGHLVFSNGTWRVGKASAGDVPVAAPTLAAVISCRLSALTPKTCAILGELAVIGEEFEVDVALASGIGDEAELLDAIDEALAAAILREDGADPGAAFAFTHREVASAARATVAPMRLRRVHERIARGFEQVRPVALFDIAAHFDLAGLGERAFEYALLAAARAVSVQAHADAAMAYDRARTHVVTPAQKARLDELIAQLPVRLRRSGVA